MKTLGLQTIVYTVPLHEALLGGIMSEKLRVILKSSWVGFYGGGIVGAAVGVLLDPPRSSTTRLVFVLLAAALVVGAAYALGRHEVGEERRARIRARHSRYEPLWLEYARRKEEIERRRARGSEKGRMPEAHNE